MRDLPDPFTILQRANPVIEDELPEVSTSAALEDALERVFSSPPPSWWRRWAPRPAPPPAVRQRRTALALVGVAVVGLAWTVYAVTNRPASSLTIGCYAAADLSSHTEVVVNDGRPPEEICGELWRRGAFGSGPVPPLVACTLSTQVVGVFPEAGSDTCANVGAAPGPTVSPSSTSPDQDPIALRDALTEAVRGERCVDERQATLIVNRELTARGLSDWTVEVAGTFTADKPCATLGVDLPVKKVLLIPAPPRP